jgi:hypothetical protein
MEIAIQKPNRLRAEFPESQRRPPTVLRWQDLLALHPERMSTRAPPRRRRSTRPSTCWKTSIKSRCLIADLLTADPQSRLVQNLKSAFMWAAILVRGVVCHHLAFQTPEVDWEIWIEDGPKPLPRRLLADRQERGRARPQMTASLSDWNLAPQFPSRLLYLQTAPERPERSRSWPIGRRPAAKPAKAAQ